MSTTQENIETKAGHPPALKVGGMRVAQRQRRDSEDGPKPTKDKSDKAVDDKQSSFNPFKPHALVTGIAPKVDPKDFPKDEIKHAHEKPIPSHQTVHHNKPTVIQQPRKQ